MVDYALVDEQWSDVEKEGFIRAFGDLQRAGGHRGTFPLEWTTKKELLPQTSA